MASMYCRCQNLFFAPLGSVMNTQGEGVFRFLPISIVKKLYVTAKEHAIYGVTETHLI